jgi:HlyD family secretion protein
MKSRTNRWLAGGLVLAVVAAGGFWLWRTQTAERPLDPAALRQEAVARGTLVSTVTATGSVAPQSSVQLSFAGAAPQPVTEVNVVLGQAVRAGEVLARLDDRALALSVTEAEQALAAAELSLALLQAPPRSEDVAVAEANLRVARNRVYAASLGSSPEEVEIARLNLVLAQSLLDQTHARMERLVEQDRYADKQALEPTEQRQIQDARIADLRYQQAQSAAPYGPVAQAQAGVEQAEAALARLQNGPSQEDVQIAELRVRQAETALEAARHNLESATLIAPFDGVVAAVNVQTGSPVAAGLPAVVLVNADRFHLEVSVDEVDVAQVTTGQAVTVTLDALPNVVFAGQVERVAPTASVNAGLVTYAVRVGLEQRDQLLRGGMTATAAIVVGVVNDALLVPNWAILRDRDTGQTFVSVLAGGQLRDVEVGLGVRDENYSQVLSGLNEGQVVAVDTTREQFNFFGGAQ